METVGSPAQHHRVAALQTQRACVGGHVRPALVDDADDAERRRHPLDPEAVGSLEGCEHAADGVGQRRNFFDGAGHRLDAGFAKRQAVDEGGG